MILKQYEGVFIVLNKFLGGFFKRTLDPFTFPAAAVHDYLYGQGAVSRKDCDALLRDIIRTRLNMSWRYWFVMWVAVRAGGTSHYTKRIIEGNTVAPVQ